MSARRTSAAAAACRSRIFIWKKSASPGNLRLKRLARHFGIPSNALHFEKPWQFVFRGLGECVNPGQKGGREKAGGRGEPVFAVAPCSPSPPEAGFAIMASEARCLTSSTRVHSKKCKIVFSSTGCTHLPTCLDAAGYAWLSSQRTWPSSWLCSASCCSPPPQDVTIPSFPLLSTVEKLPAL